ncbi:MAG: XTP/dITP diphosphatase [Lachnospiraceae bacterium]|nr:XTP/dITP diphosphatase [Lachnospiraceae bacterium]
MRRQIIFATGNMGKMREIRDILRNIDADILSMKEAGIETDIVEDGTTFEENAVIKAKAVAELLTEHEGGKYQDAIVLADDSGLEIDYLNKEPGIYSARYMGEHMPYSVKNQNLLKRLAGVPAEKRSARFVCAIAAVMPDGEVITTLGTIEGRIGDQAEGENGFGYDPIFYVPEYGCTTAQLTEEEKNRISHRGRALEAMEAELKRKL